MTTQYNPTEQGWDWFNPKYDIRYRPSSDERLDIMIFEIISFDPPITLEGIMEGTFTHSAYMPRREEVVRRSLRRLFEFGYINQVDDNDESF